MKRMAETDYRAICLELFGTDDVEKLKMIAKQIGQKNTRNAGRKRKFNEAETEEMKRLPRAGMLKQSSIFSANRLSGNISIRRCRKAILCV